MTRLETRIRELTKPINGQYPRPWMTDSRSPESAKVFIVGFNQARTFPVELVNHDSYIDALFNRNGCSISRLYDEASGGKGSSKTRENIKALTCRLEQCGIFDVIQTNVVCYSTPMSVDLSHTKHTGGAQRGRELFETLLEEICPAVLVAHGARTRKALSKLLVGDLPALPGKADDEVSIARNLKYRSTDRPVDVFLIPSLAPPAWNVWQNWAYPYFDKLARSIRAKLG